MTALSVEVPIRLEVVPFRHVPTLVEAVLSTLPSANSRRAYATHLREYLASGHGLTREGIASYLAKRRRKGLGAAGQVQLMAAVKKLATEARVRGLIDDREEYAIHKLKADRPKGLPAGNWLTLEQAQQLIALPDRSTLIGCRDAALLAILVGCGLRREEVLGLCWWQLQEREGRPMLVDIYGKGRKVRSVPVPRWAYQEIDIWRQARQPSENARIIVAIDSHGNPTGALSGSGLWKIVSNYASRLGVEFHPHDLRRTLARLMRTAGVGLEQIQHTLGHSSIETTMCYLGTVLELRDGEAGVDKVAIMPKIG